MMDNPFVKLMFAPDALPWMTAIDTNDGPWTQWFFAAGRSRRLAGSAPVGLCRELVGNLSKTLPEFNALSSSTHRVDKVPDKVFRRRNETLTTR
jgi:hypothetical protein